MELTAWLLCGGSRFHDLCLHYQVEDSQGGNIWSWGQGASAGSCLHGLGLTTEQSRAEQRWLYLQVFGSKWFLGPMQCLVALISDYTLLYIFFQFKVPYTGVVDHQNTVSIAWNWEHVLHSFAWGRRLNKSAWVSTGSWDSIRGLCGAQGDKPAGVSSIMFLGSCWSKVYLYFAQEKTGWSDPKPSRKWTIT